MGLGPGVLDGGRGRLKGWDLQSYYPAPSFVGDPDVLAAGGRGPVARVAHGARWRRCGNAVVVLHDAAHEAGLLVALGA